MSVRVLLTGGAGFIGSHTYVALVSAGYDVVILDNFENAQDDIPSRLQLITNRPTEVIRADIRDTDAIASAFEQGGFGAVVHFAAKKSVPESEADPAAYYRANINGLMNVTEAALANGVKAFVFSSSASVYGNAAQMPITEDTAIAPESTYARTKAMGEAYLQDLAKVHPDCAMGLLRYFNPVGAHPSGLIGEDPAQTPTNLVPVIARVANGQLPELQVYGGDYPTADGTGVRDYIHVMDLAEGHVLSLNKLLETGESHLVNLGTGRGNTVLEVVQTYEKVLGHPLPHKVVDRRPGDPSTCYASVDRAADLLGFRARFDLLSMCESNWAYARQDKG